MGVETGVRSGVVTGAGVGDGAGVRHVTSAGNSWVTMSLSVGNSWVKLPVGLSFHSRRVSSDLSKVISDLSKVISDSEYPSRVLAKTINSFAYFGRRST